MPTTTERGYDYKHRQLRKQVARHVATGTATCSRCGKRIDPSEAWDLGHDDHNRTIYRGPEHAACNRATRRHHAEAWPTRNRPAQAHPGVGEG